MVSEEEAPERRCFFFVFIRVIRGRNQVRSGKAPAL